MPTRKSVRLYLLTLAGFLALLAGTSALQASRWAVLRPLLLAAGLVGLARWGYRLLDQAGKLPPRLQSGLGRAGQGLNALARGLLFSPRIGLGFALLVLALIGLFAAWYASLGLFPRFPQVGNLYINQANAFLHGQLALVEPPSPQILALPDPYPYDLRKGLPYLWDASLYRGRYYLYWGPVPALILTPIMALNGGAVPDPLMVLLAALGIGAVVTWLLWQVRRCLYPQAPALSVGLFMLPAVINLPYLFLLGRGRVYETSILTGQLFLVLGLAGYFAYAQLRRPGGLALAGLGWGLAITCRYNLALSVGVCVAFVLWSLWQPRIRLGGGPAAARSMREAGDLSPAPPAEPDQAAAPLLASSAGSDRAITPPLASPAGPARSATSLRPSPAGRIRATTLLLAPLALCLMGLGLFNALRFGSPFETGLNYQLTAPVAGNQHFSPEYLRASFYLNVLYPYRRVETFPLIRSIAVEPHKAPAWAQYPPGKQVDETVFSLRLLPFIWLLALAPLWVILAWRERRNAPAPIATGAGPIENADRRAVNPVGDLGAGRRLAWMLGLAGLLQFGLLLAYYYSAVRFMADYSLAFILLAALLVWSLDRRLVNYPWARLLLWAGVALAALLTVILGFLAGFDNPPRVFQIYNPALEQHIAAVWNGWYTSPGLVGKLLRYLLAAVL